MQRSTKEGLAILVVLAVAVFVVYWYTGDDGDGGDEMDDPTGDSGATMSGSDGTAQDVSGLTYTGTITQQYEGLSLTAYPDAGGYSIGYGHFGATPGETITQDQADAYLQDDLASAVATVQKYVNVPLTQDQFNGLVDWVYNLGAAKAALGSVFSKVNAGDYSGVVSTLESYVYSGGQKLAGLLPRRIAEAAGFVDSSS